MVMGITGASCVRADVKVADVPDPAVDLEFSGDAGPQTAIFAGGCFWCAEAVFARVEGVSDVTYDPAAVSYGTLLKVFFTVAHDPTQLNRQGPDVGRHSRTAVFYQSDDEKGVAQAYIDQLTEAGVFGDPIVTTLEPFGEGFYVAEEYHQDYAEANPGQPYIVFQAQLKVAKLEKALADLLDVE